MAVSEKVKGAAMWTWSQVRRFLLVQAVVVGVTALLAGFGTYWYAAYVDIAKRIEDKMPDLHERQAAWINASSTVFARSNVNLAEDARLPSKTDVREILGATNALITELNEVPTPTQGIEDAAVAFRSSLSDVVLEAGRYDGSVDAALRVVVASQRAAQVGDVHRSSIEDYLGSAFQRLRGSFL